MTRFVSGMVVINSNSGFERNQTMKTITRIIAVALFVVAIAGFSGAASACGNGGETPKENLVQEYWEIQVLGKGGGYSCPHKSWDNEYVTFTAPWDIPEEVIRQIQESSFGKEMSRPTIIFWIKPRNGADRGKIKEKFLQDASWDAVGDVDMLSGVPEFIMWAN